MKGLLPKDREASLPDRFVNCDPPREWCDSNNLRHVNIVVRKRQDAMKISHVGCASLWVFNASSLREKQPGKSKNT
jgi:hypothetical protein